MQGNGKERSGKDTGQVKGTGKGKTSKETVRLDATGTSTSCCVMVGRNDKDSSSQQCQLHRRLSTVRGGRCLQRFTVTTAVQQATNNRRGSWMMHSISFCAEENASTCYRFESGELGECHESGELLLPTREKTCASWRHATCQAWCLECSR